MIKFFGSLLVFFYVSQSFAHDVTPLLKNNTSELQVLADKFIAASPKERTLIIQEIESKAEARYALLEHLYVHQPLNLSSVLSEAAMQTVLRNRLVALTRKIEAKLERRGAQMDGYLHVRVERLNSADKNGSLKSEKFFVHSSDRLDSSSLPAQIFGYPVQAKNALSRITIRNAIEVLAENGRKMLAYDKYGANTQIAYANGPGGGGGGGGSGPVTGERTALTIIANFLDTVPLPESPDVIHSRMFNNSDSFKNFFLESSYNKLNFSGQVTPWITLNRNVNGDCSDDAWIDEAGRKASQLGYNVGSYNHVIYVFIATNGSTIRHSCSFAGWGYLPGSITINLGSVSGTYYNFPMRVIRHEVGHNIGLHHANFYDCGSTMIDGTCTDKEYGDPTSEMGWNGPFNAPERISLGWTASSNVQSVTSNGRFRLAPLHTIDTSAKVLKISRGSGKPLYISYRQGPGAFEHTLNGASFHIWSGYRGDYTSVIDTHPISPTGTSDQADAALGDGESFEDLKNNIKVTQVSHDNSGVVLDVSFDPITCIDKPVSVTQSLSSYTVQAGKSFSVVYTLSNSSSLKCNSKVVALSTIVPNEITLSPTPTTSLTLAPGQTSKVAFTLTAPSTLMAGTYFPALVVDGVSCPVAMNVITDSAPPSAPTNVKATQSANSIVVTWDASTDDNGIARYHLFKSIPGVSTYNSYVYSTQFIDTNNLVSGVTYTYWVIAIDTFGKNSTQSAKVSITFNGVADTTPPVVQISSPMNGQTVSGTISVNATASDNVGISNVDFYVDGVRIMSDTISPYSAGFDTKTHSNSNSVLKAVARDTSGNVSEHLITVNVSNFVDTEAPVVQITSPANGQAVSGTISVSAMASDNVAVSLVDFYVDGVKVGSDSVSPYSLSYDTKLHSNSNAVFKAVAKDAAGNFAEHSVSVVVNNASADTVAPTVTITAPVDGSYVAVRQTISLSATAQDNVAVSRVEFYVNGAMKCTSSSVSANFTCAWKVSGKKGASYKIQARAIDTSGNAGLSPVITVYSK